MKIRELRELLQPGQVRDENGRIFVSVNGEFFEVLDVYPVARRQKDKTFETTEAVSIKIADKPTSLA